MCHQFKTKWLIGSYLPGFELMTIRCFIILSSYRANGRSYHQLSQPPQPPQPQPPQRRQPQPRHPNPHPHIIFTSTIWLSIFVFLTLQCWIYVVSYTQQLLGLTTGLTTSCSSRPSRRSRSRSDASRSRAIRIRIPTLYLPPRFG